MKRVYCFMAHSQYTCSLAVNVHCLLLFVLLILIVVLKLVARVPPRNCTMFKAAFESPVVVIIQTNDLFRPNLCDDCTAHQ